jgi:hypothetical protein
LPMLFATRERRSTTLQTYKGLLHEIFGTVLFMLSYVPNNHIYTSRLGDDSFSAGILEQSIVARN